MSNTSNIYQDRAYWDYIIGENPTSGDFETRDRNGVLISDDADFGTQFNATMTLMDNGGVPTGTCAIQGDTTYTYAVTPTVVGDGSYLEKPIDIIGVGGSFPKLTPDEGVVGFEYGGGCNIHLHRLHIDQPTGGAGVTALKSVNAGGGAYGETGCWFGKFGDIKIEGGVAGENLWHMEDAEWYQIYGRIIAIGASGVHPVLFENTAAAAFSYHESVMNGQMFITTVGEDTVGLEFLGDSAHKLNLMNWGGSIWIKNTVPGSDGSIGVKSTYQVNSRIGQIHVETVDTMLQVNAGTMTTNFDFGNTYNIFTTNGSNKIGLDMNSGSYNCTIQNFLCYFGSFTAVWVDDDNDDGNAPHKYENITLQGNGGVCTEDLGAQAIVESIGATGRNHRRLGSGTFP